ncbi:DUF4374 domain-containing protein [Sphingobacterium corticibacterium]|uniref:DUF4374 domain-containing protein n=1 Tax=Sphingobacterium corticibacterium TaxID=2484746 RepID=A0A4Q6XXJ2_9SPHI|nr:DUF4374 domain-containing protein [Sphingobacterium corticibacterium]RZF61527.1 DUF4374 domain-containing protein [Sphingobacterium corticibacterium]
MKEKGMSKYNVSIIVFFSMLYGLMSLTSCQSPQNTGKPAYSMFFMTTDERQFIWQTDQVDSGIIDPTKQGVILDRPARIWYYMLVQNGFYYFVDSKTEYLIKGKITDNQFLRLDSVYLEGFSYPDNACFLDDNQLLIVNHSVGRKKKSYAKIDVRDMQVHIGELAIEAPQGVFDNMSVGFVYRRESQLWMGYTYHYTNSKMGYGSADTVYVARFSYPDMKLLSVDKDARSTYPGNVNTAQQNTFEDEDGNFYFMSAPGIVRGANPKQPTAIYRIKKGENHLDSAYFYNISDSPIQNHAYGMWYLGDNKALVRSERKDLFNDYKEHYLLPHIEFYEIDLLDRAHVSKLDLPLDRGSSRTCVLLEDEIAYITINDGEGNNDVWLYRSKEQTLEKGLHIAGEIDYIFRIDRLYGE